MISSRKHTYYMRFSDLKPGDVLTVRSKDWYDKNRTTIGSVFVSDDQVVFTDYMCYLCGKQVTVRELIKEYRSYKNCILIREDGYVFHTWMFEGFEFPPEKQ